MTVEQNLFGKNLKIKGEYGRGAGERSSMTQSMSIMQTKSRFVAAKG